MQSLSLYRSQSRGVRLHTRLRAWSAPLEAVVEALPRNGSILDVGCGHGLVANEAALRREAVRVLGVDVSAAKIRAARASVGDRKNIEFREAFLEDVAETGFDAVALIDVLYLVPVARWNAFLEICLGKLKPGGSLVLKEIATEPRWKFERLKLQEFMSTRILRITTGSTMHFEPLAQLTARLETIGFRAVRARRLDAGYTSPHVLITAQRASA